VKVILCQPAIPYLKWQLEVLLANIRQLSNVEVVLLFTDHDFTIPGYFRKKYPECGVFNYPERENRNYIPSVKPYLFWQYLAQDPAREQEDYFYIDADVIFREWIDCTTLGFDANTWVASHCKGYIGYDDYLKTLKDGEAIISRMAEICGITVQQAKAAPSAGAQWVISQPTAEYWHRVYDDCVAIHNYFEPLDSEIQKWTAEMWAQLYGVIREGKTVKISPELDFIMPTDDVARWDEVKILHNAGVTNTELNLFYKGGFIDKSPFGRDFPQVDPSKASIKYVEAVKKVLL
jgi:hypothetical protein